MKKSMNIRLSRAFALWALAFTSISLAQKKEFTPKPVEFVILITSYNNELYVEENLTSVVFQNATNPYQIIYVNDCSRDSTQTRVDEFVKKHDLSSRMLVIHNTERVGALANIYNTIHQHIPDHKVVVSVDGDDKLAHNDVLLRLEKEYSNPDTWVTYGTARVYPDGHTKSKKIPREVFETGILRKMSFRSQHLRTFKAGLFKKIKKEDLQFEGTFYSMAWDLAIMFPMLEMAGPREPGAVYHSQYIKDILYYYNRGNPLNDFKTNRKLQRRLDKNIRSLPPYQPLEQLEEQA